MNQIKNSACGYNESNNSDSTILSCMGVVVLLFLLLIAPYVFIGFQQRSINRLSNRVDELERQVATNNLNRVHADSLQWNSIYEISDIVHGLRNSLESTSANSETTRETNNASY